jgi:hypothetical protein
MGDIPSDTGMVARLVVSAALLVGVIAGFTWLVMTYPALMGWVVIGLLGGLVVWAVAYLIYEKVSNGRRRY